MRWVDFLMCLLEAHGHTLQRLAAMFGDEMLLAMLEESAERLEDKARAPELQPAWFDPGSGFSSPYAELESAVHECRLPATLEFHLWAYPYYRSCIEDGIELDARVSPAKAEQVIPGLVEDAVSQAQAWCQGLPIPPEFALQAQQAAQMPWLKFRTQVMKKIGKRPLGVIK